MKLNDVLSEEECGTGFRLGQEVLCEGCNPSEQIKSSTRLKDEECDSLLQEKADDDSWPRNPAAICRCEEETKLEYEKAEDGDRAVPVVAVLFIISIPGKRYEQVHGRQRRAAPYEVMMYSSDTPINT